MKLPHWRVRRGDILDEPADVLVCAANPHLTLSGGVGGALLLRYGPALQTELNDHLDHLGRRHVDVGTVVATEAIGTPYRAVIHAVAVNAFYESSPAIVTGVVRAALAAAAQRDARTVALAAVATGYGHLTIAQFAAGLSPLTAEPFPPIERVTVVVRGADDPAEVHRVVPTVELA